MTNRTPSSASSETATPPAYFLSLTVENVRCFGPAQTLDLSDGKGRPARWTLILGENGLGKSTLLQCLAATEPAYHVLGSWQVSDIVAKAAHLRNFGAEHEFFRYDHTQSSVTARLESGSKITDVANRLTKNLRIIWGVIDGTLMGRHFGKYDKDLGGLICYGYGVNRRIGYKAVDITNIDDPALSLFSGDVLLRDPESWWLQSDYNARFDRPDKYRFERYTTQVRDALVHLLPNVEELRIAPPRDLTDRARVEALTPFGWVPLRRLGSGYQSQIAWVVDLASRLFERYPESDDPLAEPAVVLIDEIDLHMHPRWQREIIGYLTERLPNTQFIVTAHSPLIVQAAEDANLVLLRREGDHVIIDNDPGRLRNWRVDQILTSDLFGLESARPPQIEGLLNERRALLSKGRLTANDRRRIQALEAEIGDLPAGESVEDSRAMEIIRRAAAKLQGEGGA